MDVTLAHVDRTVSEVPYMTMWQAEKLLELGASAPPGDILELGFAFGKGSAYLGAIASLQGRTVTAVDNLSALGRVPRADETVSRAGVSEYVDLVFAPDGYLWWMLQQIESGTSERFSLIYLDGSHSWFIDGFAVNLLSHFLKEGGYLILDDLDWTFEDPEVRNSEIARGMSAEARAVPHIRQVWELLILADPGWGEFEEINDWGIARRVQASEQRGKVEKVVVRRTLREEVGALTAEVGRRLRR